MKFMVINHYKDSLYALTSEQQASLKQEAMSVAEKYLKTGGCKEVFMFYDMKGSVSFWDVDSAEEWMRIAMEYPLNPYIDQERIPVVEYNTASKIMKESMAAAQKKALQKVPAMSR